MRLVARSAARRAGGTDFLEQRHRLRFRRDAELPRQKCPAVLELLDGARRLAAGGVDTHQPPVQRLSQGVEGYSAERQFGHPRQVVVRERRLGRGVEHRDLHLPQPLTLGQEPLLDGVLAHREALEQFAAEQRHRAGTAVGMGGAMLQLDDVDGDRGAVERDRVARCRQGRCGRAKGLPRLGQRLPQTDPSLILAAALPQQGGQGGACYGTPRCQGGSGEQKLGLARRQGARVAIHRQAESTKKLKATEHGPISSPSRHTR